MYYIYQYVFTACANSIVTRTFYDIYHTPVLINPLKDLLSYTAFFQYKTHIENYNITKKFTNISK